MRRKDFYKFLIAASILILINIILTSFNLEGWRIPRMEEVELLYRINGEVTYDRFLYNIFKIVKLPFYLTERVIYLRWVTSVISTLTILLLFLSLYYLTNDIRLSFLISVFLCFNSFFNLFSRSFMIDIYTNLGVSISLLLFSIHMKKKLSFNKFFLSINFLWFIFLLIYPTIIFFIISFTMTYVILFRAISLRKRFYFLILTVLIVFIFSINFIYPILPEEIEWRYKRYNLESKNLTLANIVNFGEFISKFNKIFFPQLQSNMNILIIILCMPLVFLLIKGDFNTNFFYLIFLISFLGILLFPFPFLNPMYFSQIIPFYFYSIIFSILYIIKNHKITINLFFVMVLLIFVTFYFKENLEVILININRSEVKFIENFLGKLNEGEKIPVKSDLYSLLILYHSDISEIYTDKPLYCHDRDKKDEITYITNSKNGINLANSYLNPINISVPKVVFISIFCENQTINESIIKEFKKTDMIGEIFIHS